MEGWVVSEGALMNLSMSIVVVEVWEALALDVKTRRFRLSVALAWEVQFVLPHTTVALDATASTDHAKHKKVLE